MFRIKICGMTTSDDARAAADVGADAIGLNFYEKSRRFVLAEAAERIARAVPDHVMKVGVFVNAAADEIRQIVDRVGLDCVQLHGDEPPTLSAQLPPRVVIVRAHRCGADGLAPLAHHLTVCRTLGRVPDAVLVDADAASDFGGTGRVADWSLIAGERELVGAVPLILAGGLTPDNVGEAIDLVHPNAVDTASGVETTPGRKDAALLARFVAAAREAFGRHEGRAS